MTVADLYHNQPLLAAIARNLQVTKQVAALIPRATQVGYALGIFLVKARLLFAGVELQNDDT